MKSIFSASYNNIIDKYIIVKPDFQRIIDPLKVQEIVDWQKNNYKERGYFCYTGTIIFVNYKDTYVLIDGQHRFSSLEQLNRENIFPEVDFQIWNVDTEDEMRDIYNLHNKNTPLPELNFEGNSKSLIENICSYYRNKYPKAWKQDTGKRINRPFLSFNKFQEACNFLSIEMNWLTLEEFTNHIDSYNTVLSNRSLTSFPNITTTMYDKAKQWGFYIGLYNYEPDKPYIFRWVYNIIEHFAGPQKAAEYRISKQSNRIPKTLRNRVWNTYIGDNIAKAYCICCNDKVISMQEFECGHVLSDANNGSQTLENLRPICGCCNKSMGKEHMKTFIEKVFPDNVLNFNNKFYTPYVEPENIKIKSGWFF